MTSLAAAVPGWPGMTAEQLAEAYDAIVAFLETL